MIRLGVIEERHTDSMEQVAFLSVVMGAFNEEAAIEGVILKHVQVLQKLQPQVPSGKSCV